VLLGVLVGSAIAASIVSSWPSDRLEPWVFLAAVLVALVPVALLLIDFAAERRATVGITRFFSVDFSAGAAAAGSAERGQTITPNIVGSGVDVADSGREEMRSALESASESDVVEIDLASGEAWWPTRLLVLTAAGARLGRPAALSFVARDRARDRVFQGWAYPQDLLDQMLRRDPQLRFVYWYARRAWAGQFALPNQQASFPYWDYVRDPERIKHHAATATDVPTTQISRPANQIPQDVGPEMLLANELAPYEPPDHGISAADLRALAGPVLHHDVIDVADPPERQIDVALRSTDQYIAVADEGRHRGLAQIDHIVRDLLRSTITALTERR
jgi:hypothetical protein